MLHFTLRGVWLPASYLAFLSGAFISAAILYQAKPLDPEAAILSDLESPDLNPHGYLALAAGVALSAILLAPADVLFYRCLRKSHPRLALTAAIVFAAGLASAIAIGILAPDTHGYTPLHVQLASAAFIGISSGSLLFLFAARAARRLVALQSAALLTLAYLCYGPVDFDNNNLLTSLAFWEWILCAECAAILWKLAAIVEAR